MQTVPGGRSQAAPFAWRRGRRQRPPKLEDRRALETLSASAYTSASAAVVKLVDTLDLGSSASGVGVQVPPAAPLTNSPTEIRLKALNGKAIWGVLAPSIR